MANILDEGRELLASTLRLSLGLGAVVWIIAFMATEIAPPEWEGTAGADYSWDFREALVLFVFGTAALVVIGAGILYLTRFLFNLLRGGLSGSSGPSSDWTGVLMLACLLAAQLASFTAIPTLKSAFFGAYHGFRALDERSSYEPERDTALRKYLEQAEKGGE